MLFTKSERVINFSPQFPLSTHGTPGTEKKAGVVEIFKKVNSPFFQRRKIPIGLKATKVSSPWQQLIMTASRCLLWLATVVVSDACGDSKWSDAIASKWNPVKRNFNGS